jgi:hypothetical protein
VKFLFKLTATEDCDAKQKNYFAGDSVEMWSGQAQVLRLCEHGDQEYCAEGITLYSLVEIY